MNFTSVTVKRSTEGLARTTGFWSEKPILINTSSEPIIYLLNENAKSSDLLTCIDSYIDANLRGWVITFYKKWVPTVLEGDFFTPYFNLQGLPTLSRPEWKVHGHIAAPKIVNTLTSEGKNVDDISTFLADTWVNDWRFRPSLDVNYSIGAPGNLLQTKILLIPWSKLDISMTAEEFLQGLSKIAEMDLSVTRFFAPKTKPYLMWSKSEVLQAGLTEIERSLLKRFGVGRLLSGDLTQGDAKTLLALPQCASLALALLARDGHILISDYLPGSLNTATTDLGMQETFGSMKKNKLDRMGLSGLLLNSNIREIIDIPADLRDHLPKDQWRKSTGGRTLWRPLRVWLLDYAKENKLKPFDISPFEHGAGSRKECKKWSPQWFRNEKHPKEWCDFVACAFESSNANEHTLTAKVGVLAGWGLSRFTSPWEIKPVDLRDPFRPSDPESFFEYCKGIGRDSWLAWSQTAGLFKTVVNAASVPGYPWQREKAVNPFKNITNPFSSSNNRGNGKTHRTRIATVIHEKMIEVLLDLDAYGKPTFQWAKDTFGRGDVKDGVWCPSRFTLLAIMLLLPLRKKQSRWLCQGLMDETVFDPETFQMTENIHRLKDYRYEDDKTHLQRYGRPSGAIQPITEDFMGSTNHLGIFVNTNKTQLWNPTKHNGYELPWPDGSELLASDDEELQQHGMWLRRVYEVLAYQYRYVLEHDPDPVPITFYDVSDDKVLVSQHEHIKSHMPFFVPLFRDVANPKQVRRGEDLVMANLPVTPVRIQTAYTALCMEVENRLREDGFKSVTLTTAKNITTSNNQDTPEGKNASGCEELLSVSYRNPKFDLHCLRVAGISRLIEMDIDPVIIQEFVAGHLTPAMTHRYIKLQPWYVREKIIEAIVNGDFKTAKETFSEKVAKGEVSPEANFVSAVRFREHIKDLPEGFASFAVVEGGVCVAGGKGDACDEGGVYERDKDKKDETETFYGPVRGGCGNCRHFRSAYFLIQEQALYLDVLMWDLIGLARERREIRTKISNIKCQIDDCKDTREQTRLINDLNLLKGRVESLNHNMVPAIAEWVNRHQILIECEAQMEDGQQMALVAPFQTQGFTSDDFKIDGVEMTTEIGLAGRIVEKARMVNCRGIPIPVNPARMLEQSCDRLLRMNGSTSLLLDISASQNRIHGASMFMNMLENVVGAEMIQDALDNSKPLALPDAKRDAINQFANAIVETANKGTLAIDSVSKVANSCNLISDVIKGDERWAI